MDQVETAKYRITGLVDIFDEQHNITGQFPIGSIQELPVEVGMKCVEEGTAEAVGSEEDGEEDADTTPAGEEDAADEATGETGEEEVDSEEQDEDEGGEDNDDEVI